MCLPLERRAGSWKQRLFPPPVGMMSIQSLPDIVMFIVCSCIGRSCLILNTDCNFSISALDQLKSAFWNIDTRSSLNCVINTNVLFSPYFNEIKYIWHISFFNLLLGYAFCLVYNLTKWITLAKQEPSWYYFTCFVPIFIPCWSCSILFKNILQLTFTFQKTTLSV